MIKIKLVKGADSKAISNLNYQYIPSGFLSSLGTSFLRLMYNSMINSKYAFCIIAKKNEKIVGFVSGTINVGRFYKFFFKKIFLKQV